MNLYKSYKMRFFIPNRCTISTLGRAKGSNSEIIKPFSLQSFLVFISFLYLVITLGWSQNILC